MYFSDELFNQFIGQLVPLFEADFLKGNIFAHLEIIIESFDYFVIFLLVIAACIKVVLAPNKVLII